jgi:hypothetical protein
MGKRKLNDRTFYVCDWTGLPMRDVNCFIPLQINNKIQRKGMFCCWEAALAYAAEKYADAVEQVRTDMEKACGYKLPLTLSTMHFSRLDHFFKSSQQLSGSEYLLWCEYESLRQAGSSLTAVCIPVTGALTTVEFDRFPSFDMFKANVSVDGLRSLSPPYQMGDYSVPLYEFEPIRGRLDRGDRICIFGPRLVETQYVVNRRATAQLKFKKDRTARDRHEIRGEVVMFICSDTIGASNLKLYKSCTMDKFDNITNKRKRKVNVEHATTAHEFDSDKRSMDKELCEYEQSISRDAIGHCAAGAKMPPRDGKQVAAVAPIVNASVEAARKLCKLEMRMRGDNGVPLRKFSASVFKLKL